MPEIKKLGKIEVVAFDRPEDDWGLLSNYANTPISMQTPIGSVSFPTVEHYFQYMKNENDAGYLKRILSNPDPQHARDLGAKCFDEVSKSDPARAAQLKSSWQKGGADLAMNAGVSAKLQQHKAVLNTLMQTENACLVEDTGSRKNPRNQDGNWGWKTGGEIDSHKGAGNKLGILFMQKRNEIYAAQNNKNRLVDNPSVLSEAARSIMKTNYPHDNLIKLGLSSRKVVGAATNPDAKEAKDQAAVQPTKMATERILNKLKGAVKLEVVPDRKLPHQNVIKITFDNSEVAQTFANYARGAPLEGNTVIMGPKRAQTTFQKLGIGTQGRTNPHDMFDALVYEHKQGQQRSSVANNPSPMPHFAMTAAPAPSTTMTAHNRVLKKLNDAGYAKINLEVAPDSKLPHQNVIKITFDNPGVAKKFSDYAGGAPLEGNTVIMGPKRAQAIFQNLGIGMHGKTKSHKMFDSLVYEHEQAQKTQTFSYRGS